MEAYALQGGEEITPEEIVAHGFLSPSASANSMTLTHLDLTTNVVREDSLMPKQNPKIKAVARILAPAQAAP